MLSPLLLEEELHIIFGRVSNLFSKSLADAYARLEPLVRDSFLYLLLSYLYFTEAFRWQACMHVQKRSSLRLKSMYGELHVL